MVLWKTLRGDTSGNVIAISAAMFVPVVALVGAALDISVAYLRLTR